MKKHTILSHVLLYVICLTSVLLIVPGCYKDSDDMETVIKEDEPQEVVSGHLALRVVTADGEPALGTSFTIDGITKEIKGPLTSVYATDVYKKSTLALLHHPVLGDIPYVLHCLANDVSYHDISLPGNLNETSVSGTETNITSANVNIHLTSTAFLKQGEPYSGSAIVRTMEQVISPGMELSTVPGEKIGYDEDNVPQLLDVQTLFYFGATTQDGVALDLTEKGVTISVANVCSDCTVLHMTETGKWQAIASVQSGSDRTLTAPGVGFYCIAKGDDFITLKGSIQAHGEAVPHTLVEAFMDQKILATTYSGNQGGWEMRVPAGAALDLKVNTACGVSEQIPVTTSMSSETLPAIDLSDDIQITELTGTARDCQDAILSGAYLITEEDGAEQQLYVPDGTFTVPVASCNGAFSLRAQTTDWKETGPAIPWEGTGKINAHSVYACSDILQGYLTIRILGDHKLYRNTNSDLTSGQRTTLLGTDPANPDATCQLWITGMHTGTFADTDLNIQFIDMTLSNGGYSLYCPTSSAGCGFETFEVTHYGETDDWIRGYFKGKFWVKTFSPLTAGDKQIEGEFQIYRNF